jgi:hypothetical protein
MSEFEKVYAAVHEMDNNEIEVRNVEIQNDAMLLTIEKTNPYFHKITTVKSPKYVHSISHRKKDETNGVPAGIHERVWRKKAKFGKNETRFFELRGFTIDISKRFAHISVINE